MHTVRTQSTTQRVGSDTKRRATRSGCRRSPCTLFRAVSSRRRVRACQGGTAGNCGSAYGREHWLNRPTPGRGLRARVPGSDRTRNALRSRAASARPVGIQGRNLAPVAILLQREWHFGNRNILRISARDNPYLEHCRCDSGDPLRDSALRAAGLPALCQAAVSRCRALRYTSCIPLPLELARSGRSRSCIPGSCHAAAFVVQTAVASVEL